MALNWLCIFACVAQYSILLTVSVHDAGRAAADRKEGCVNLPEKIWKTILKDQEHDMSTIDYASEFDEDGIM